jgi:magnesium chelatase family protein
MTPRDIKAFCALDRASEKLIENAVERLGLSARSYHRILKIGRTIADLDWSESVQAAHIAEAVQYRGYCPDRCPKTPDACLCKNK